MHGAYQNKTHQSNKDCGIPEDSSDQFLNCFFHQSIIVCMFLLHDHNLTVTHIGTSKTEQLKCKKKKKQKKKNKKKTYLLERDIC